MKNKSIIIMIFAIVIMVLLILTGILIVTKNSENKLQEVEGTTVVDVTGLVIGEETEHKHIIETKYDETNHWEECIICGKKQNIKSHTYVDNGWTMGTSCSEKNVHKYSCECGYSYTTTVGRPGHNMKTLNYKEGFYYGAECQNRCGYGTVNHYCHKADGTRINCLNLGRCSSCNFNYTASNSFHLAWAYNSETSKDVRCLYCNQVLGTVNYCKLIKLSNNSYKIQVSVSKNWSTFQSENFDSFGGKFSITGVQSNNSGNTFTFERIVTFNEYREIGGSFQTNMWGRMSSGLNATIAVHVNIGYLDSGVPEISNITVDENSTDISEWSQTKTIRVEGIENYCKSVKAKIIDENEEIVAEGETSVTNQTYSISFTPNIEADEIGKTFKVVVTDACENSTEQEFTVSKIDRIAPEPVSGNEILGDWAKSKEFTFLATDYGIGNVSIGFNDVLDYALATKNGTEYSRDYKFVGDVYTPTKANVFYKDELGNLKTQEIIIDKIDNTAPTITDVKLNKNKLSITSNDNHSTLGEGSGVEKYRYVTSENKLENVETLRESTEVAVDEEIVISNLNETKYVYIVAEDKVGNISEVYEYKIPGLELTTEVDLLGENGKGVIKLDWSSYDTENKTFKVYKKKEGQTEWELVSTIDSNGEMIDNLAGDLKAPSIPTISATGIKEENKIKISYSAEDKGSKYSYYIEAVDTEDNALLLSTSNEREETVTTGIKGYYYVINETSENIDFDISAGTYVEDENIILDLTENGKCIHIKAVDVAGNIGEAKVLEIGVKSNQVINLDGGKLNGEANPKLEAGLVGKTIDLGIPEKEGYTFDKWEVTEGSINGEEYTYGMEDGEITAKWIKNSYDYKVEYYYNGVKDEKETETGNSEFESSIEEYTEKLKVGYKLDRVENIPLKITTNVENNIIKVYYTIDENQTKELSYTVEYYKENEKVEEDTEIEKKRVQVLQEDYINVETSKINIVDKYRGYKLDRTEPASIPSRIEDGGVIKVYYIRKIANIEVKYIDELTGEEIETKEVITGIEGDNYKTNKKEIEGYELVEEPINASGEMREGSITIAYKYRKLSKVTVKYIDLNSGKELDKEEKTYKEGESYTTEAKEINGYKLVETPENANEVVEREDIEVIYGYKKIAGGVIVKHIEKENDEVIEEEKIEGLVGEKYSTRKLELEKYNYIEVVGNIEGEFEEESIEVSYYYEKKQAIVEIIYEDEKGKEIYKEIMEGKVGEKYKVEVKDIENYKVVKEPTNIEGIYTVDEIVVKFIVEKIKSKVEINIVDEKGNIIEVIEKEGYIGDKEEIELPEIDGYYTEEKSIFIEYGKENNIKITYKKKLFDLPNTSDINIYVYIGIFVVSLIIVYLFIRSSIKAVNKIR